MARSARQIGESGIYHVMFRGINQSQLFYDDEDRLTFLDRLALYQEEIRFSLYAYSLMDNHVHLLVRVDEGQLPLVAKKLALGYSSWFNRKYDRSGYLFQGRYKSEPVDSPEYLLTVLAYIHQNPVKVGRPLSYWTSYDAYIAEKNGQDLVDTAFILETLGGDRRQAVAEFKWLVEHRLTDGSVLSSKSSPRRIGDAKAIELIKQLGKVAHCQEVAGLPHERRDAVFVALRDAGCSVRQIARLTGANRGNVHRAWKGDAKG